MDTPGALLDWTRSSEGRKAIKYMAVSVISTAFSQAAFILVYGVFSVFGPRGSSIFATCVGTVPSYYLNRNWAWGKSGRSHLMKEVVPFWALALVGLVFSTWAVDYTHTHVAGIHNHAEHTAILAAAYLGSFGALWFAKFLIFNRFLFIDHGHPGQQRREEPRREEPRRTDPGRVGPARSEAGRTEPGAAGVARSS